MIPRLFAHAGVEHPAQLTAAQVTAWIDTPGLANNSIRCRLSTVRTFLRWCVKRGLADPAIVEEISDTPTARLPRTYGKTQSKYPARWLTAAEAGALITTCQDSTATGLRDEVAIRLGLLGLRATEIGTLTFGNLDQSHHITWMGKGRRPRTAQAGPALVAALTAYRLAYTAGLQRPISDDDPIICSTVTRGPIQAEERVVNFGTLATQPRRLVFRIVTDRAKQAGLGHVAPHDLRRTAAGLLHNNKSDDGAHFFDLLDIQKVLGHADPATTMKCYLSPLDTRAVINRASAVLDF